VREWIERNLGPAGRLERRRPGRRRGRALSSGRWPALLGRAARPSPNQIDCRHPATASCWPPETVAAIGRAEARRNRWSAVALWAIVALLTALLWRGHLGL